MVGGMRELFQVMEISYILIGVLVTQGILLLKLIKYLCISLCKLYLHFLENEKIRGN